MLTVDATVDLGNGVGGRGSAMSTQTGSDTLWHIENVVTGSGNDVIIASASVNVMDGGARRRSVRVPFSGDGRWRHHS